MNNDATNHPLNTILVMLTNMMLQEFAGSQVAHLHFAKYIIMKYNKLVCLDISQPLCTGPTSCEGVTGIERTRTQAGPRHQGQGYDKTSAPPWPDTLPNVQCKAFPIRVDHNGWHKKTATAPRTVGGPRLRLETKREPRSAQVPRGGRCAPRSLNQ